jgi:hypothetical protein
MEGNLSNAVHHLARDLTSNEEVVIRRDYSLALLVVVVCTDNLDLV